MQALKLSKKYPEFKQEEIFDLINRFHQIDIDGTGGVEKATVISALQQSGDADYDSVRVHKRRESVTLP
jgi:plastin-1